ncbi:MAG TPA: hypothetical protein VEK57_23285 [Thermoanaerobaculia bacterium]|nr:hypothetical protein [Thermoanaerobaculia bacterium]
MDAGIIAGLAAIAIAGIIDALLVVKWNRAYFTIGIPIFMRRVERPEGIADTSLDDLETSSKTAGGAPLLFHRFAPDLIAFRDKVFGGMMHYIPIMHGVIRHDLAEGVVRVMGILNWFPIAFLVTFAALLGKNVLDLLPFVLFVFGVIYFIQAVRYNRIAKKLGTVRTAVAG